MISLDGIVRSAQGGQAIDNLATRFGLSPEEVEGALQAMLPAIEMGVKNAAGSGGAGAVLSQLGSALHRDNYANPAGADPGVAAAQGGSVLGSLFGGGGTMEAVVRQIAAESGLPPSVIQAMLPTVVSIVMGGLSHAAGSGALGGLLSSVLGSLLGGGAAPQPSPSTPSPSAPPQGGSGGLLGSILGGLFGGGGSEGSPPASTGPAAAPQDEPPPPPIGGGGTAQATLDEISNMITAGTASSPDHVDRLAGLLGR